VPYLSALEVCHDEALYKSTFILSRLTRPWSINCLRRGVFQLYHWCDMSMWSKYRLCVTKYSSLQFSDFLCSILSFWVTLLAVAKMNRQLRFLMFFTGLVAVILPVHTHRTGFLASIIPLVVGICIVLISWVNDYTVLHGGP